MKNVIYGSKMKKVDSYTMDVIGIPSMVLMERAAFSVFLHMKENIDKYKRILCICGVGNNGADGVALARMLCIEGYKADVLTVGNVDRATIQWKEQTEIAVKCGVSIRAIEEVAVTIGGTTSYNNTEDALKAVLDTYDYVVDAIFGIGLTRNIEGVYSDVIEAVNKQRSYRLNTSRELKVYAMDVPSGLCSDTGKIMGTAMVADMTFTFDALKTGLLLYKGRDIAGKIVINPIGIPEKSYKNGLEKREVCKGLENEDFKGILARKQQTNKGNYGKILVIAGSENVYGAAYFTALAAYKMGCGLVKIITHENNRNLIYDKLPEAMIDVFRSGDEEDVLGKMVMDGISWADVVVIGPGLSKNREAKILLENTMSITKDMDKDIVIDADALNIIAENQNYKKYYHTKTVITPHIGETSRLVGASTIEIAEDIINIASSYAHSNRINMIQKDATTVVLGIESSEDKCNNRVCINTTGNAGMATGGSGDVLSGIVAAILAGGVNVNSMQEYAQALDKENERMFLSSSVAVYIHGLAGDIAAEEMGEASVTATDIIDKIPEALKILA